MAAEQSSRGRGGMSSKLKAILSATSMGEAVILANGRSATVLDDVRLGNTVGTLFLATGGSVPAWKRWIGFTAAPAGHLILDEGACSAVRDKGKSLLAVGVTEVRGEFEPGEVVGLYSRQNTEVGRGMINYSSEDIRRILGLRSDQIESTLGHVPYGEVIHRDNLALTVKAPA